MENSCTLKIFTMAISARLNTFYDPEGAIFQKYSPLVKSSVIIQGNDGANTIEQIAQQRMVAIAKTSINLYILNFYGDNISSMAETEKGRQPPLAIISTGRSEWIKSMYNAGNSILTALGKQRFKNIGDVSPFVNGDKIPLYFPYRLSQQDANNRGIYIFVQAAEYKIYVEDLAGTGITVIGYEVGSNPDFMLGFGACRYAVAKFFNHINVPKAWFLDDNVLYITNVDEFYKFEAKMTNVRVIGNSEPLWALGAHGTNMYMAQTDVVKIYNKFNDRRVSLRGNPTPYNFLQQAVFWNVDQLKKENNVQQTNFNYSPYFVNSGEDLSISYFLGMNRCQALTQCDICKGSDKINSSTDDREQVKKALTTRKEQIRQRLKESTQITIKDTFNNNKDTDLWKLFDDYQRKTQYYKKGFKEPANITYLKAGEQLLLKWMVDENGANLDPDDENSTINNIPPKLLNPLFNFSTLKYKDLMGLENEEIEYSIGLLDTSINAG